MSTTTTLLIIGKQCRLTIAELSSLCFSTTNTSTVRLVSALEKDEKEESIQLKRQEDVFKKFQNVLLSEEFSSKLSLSPSEEIKVNDVIQPLDRFIGSLTLLSLAMAQERALPSCATCQQISSALIDLVNGLLNNDQKDETVYRRLIEDSNLMLELLTILGIIPSSLSEDEVNFIQHVLIPKSLVNARMSLMISKLQTLCNRSNGDICIAALSAERLRANSKQYFDTMWYDTLKPHRSLISTAQIMRVLLEGSQYAIGGSSDTNDTLALSAVAAVPTTHGPCHEDIQTAYKTLELELNCCDDPKLFTTSSSSSKDALLFGVTRMTIQKLSNVVQQLLLLSQQRTSNNEPYTIIISSNNQSTLILVETLEQLFNQLLGQLQNELVVALQFACHELSTAKVEFQQKQAEKAARAAEYAAAQAQQQQPSTSDGKDEFEGMSEEKKQKILRKRAEKEAKAAAKKKKKDAAAGGGDGGSGSDGSSSSLAVLASQLFGFGTSQLIQLFVSENGRGTFEPAEGTSLLSPSSYDKMEQIIEALLRGGVQRTPKIAKGTRDFLPQQMMIRDEAFQIIRRVFKRHGAVEIDTPLFELKETLTGKYGEDSKLIYDLADQGGELLSLRYDLTVPFARFLALNNVGNIKRFHIGKVYRRDQPQLSKGRYREFYQCDFDIAGSYSKMVPDAECLCVAIEILSNLPIGHFMLKLNHRRLLDAILDLCGVPSDKFRTICSAVDKLDKEEWSVVKQEMIQKGLTDAVADQIGTFVLQKGAPIEMYDTLIQSGKFAKHQGAMEALEDMKVLFGYLKSMDKLQYISFDLSLARGLDYYTGVIYEAVSLNGETQVGSIGGGGRYDNLVGMFQSSNVQVPCVGVSVGIERVFTLMEQTYKQNSEDGQTLKQPSVSVLIASVGPLLEERMSIAKLLWNANISAEYSQQYSPKLSKEITSALERDIPYMIVIGEQELAEGKVQIKDLVKRDEVLVDMNEIVSTLLKKGVIPVGCEFAVTQGGMLLHQKKEGTCES